MEQPNDSGQPEAGDGDEFGALLGPLLEPAFRLALVMLDDRSEAEDAVQDATIKAWRKFPTLRRVEAMRPWFFAIVANECRMARRRRRWSWFGRADTSEDVGVVDPPSAEGVDLRAALGRLNYDRRLAVALRYYLDLPVEEVATATGVPVGTVKSRLHRALRELQTGLTTEDG